MTFSGMVERDHTYVLGPNQDQRLALVTAGSAIQGLTVSIDSDAPFVLRGRALRCKYTSGGGGARNQIGLNSVMAKWAGPDRNFRQQDYVRTSLEAPYFGQLGSPIPVWPNVLYPKQGVITVDLLNTGANAIDLTNLTFYFRGVKLFEPGAVVSAPYPAKMSPLPFVYPQLVRSLAVTQGPLRQTFRAGSLLQSASMQHPISDADFVIRGIQAGLPFSTTPVNEVFIRLYDEQEKPYSNDAIQIDVIAGNSCFGATFPADPTSVVPPVGLGPNSLGCFFPEIYLQKQHIMYYELSRFDASYGGAVAVDYPIAFIGQKVFPK